MRVSLLATLAIAACSKDVETAPDEAQIVVTPSGYELLGKEYSDVRELKMAVDGTPHLKLSLMVNEERGCVTEQRVSDAVELLKTRDAASVAFIGSSSTDACKR